MAEVFGGPFRVYSTREFPGLEPSTDLTRVSMQLWLYKVFLMQVTELVEIWCPRHSA